MAKKPVISDPLVRLTVFLRSGILDRIRLRAREATTERKADLKPKSRVTMSDIAAETLAEKFSK
jgi:hypothetical protein